MDTALLPEAWLQPPMRNAHQAAGECCHTMHALPASPRLPPVSRRPGVSRFLRQARPDLLPRDDIRRVLLMPGDSVINFRSLRIGQRCCISFEALPDRIQQLCLLRSGQAIDLASQVVHTPTTLARFVHTRKPQIQPSSRLARCRNPSAHNRERRLS